MAQPGSLASNNHQSAISTSLYELNLSLQAKGYRISGMTDQHARAEKHIVTVTRNKHNLESTTNAHPQIARKDVHVHLYIAPIFNSCIDY